MGDERSEAQIRAEAARIDAARAGCDAAAQERAAKAAADREGRR